MKQKTIRRMAAMLLALLMLLPAALAEPGEDANLGGYNPFATDETEDAAAAPTGEAASTNLFDSTTAIGTTQNADPLGDMTAAAATAAPVVNDPFGVGGATAAPVSNDPFGGKKFKIANVKRPLRRGQPQRHPRAHRRGL